MIIMSKGINQHVTPHKGGGWQLIGAGNSKPTMVAKTKKEVVDFGRKIAQHQKSELVIHGKDGRIQEKDSHGHDPFPPHG
ncbi:DUF2188 domain-containing protein [Aristaeella lactis]|nr:DUF2188 domain-containing protein [Aristaeella lactis]QUA51835.1 DUF2188 domain-containing protein [Aristaeella lactis]